MRYAKFAKPSMNEVPLKSTKLIKPSSAPLAIEDKVPDTGSGPVAGDLRLEPKGDNQAVEPEMKPEATVDAAAPSTEPQLTDFEKRMQAAMEKRTAQKAEIKRQEASAIKKRPSAAVVEYDISNKPSCPTEHGSTYYNNGKIYTCMNRMKFRVIMNVKIPSTERSVKWAKSTPSNHEWTKALVHIDGYWANPAKKGKGCKK